MLINAAVVREKGGAFKFESVEIGELREDEVLVKIVATGVCQTDEHIRNLEYPAPLPIILGHEGAGIVEKIGSAVKDLVPGDHVVLTYPYCGHCSNCYSGHSTYCRHGFELSFQGSREDGSNAYGHVHGHFFQQSSFADYAIANQRNTIKIPKDVPLELMGPLGCGIQTGAGAVLNALKVREGSNLAIFGVGSVGLAAVMAGKIANAGKIIAVDVNPTRLQTALELGATDIINPLEENLVERIKAITGNGADYVVELTARPDMLTKALDSLDLLGEVALVGGAPEGVSASLDMTQLLNGRRVRGVVQGDSVPSDFIPKLIEFYRKGLFPFDKLVSFYNFTDIEQAFADSKSGKVIKPVLRFSSK
ncbi:MAG: NAD(P)-dependent alcohol dehydrogenase [[Pasteurella] aerogenes]|nr:NAD(P)-dependent alcohol dehydrogenase [[Pasteurella] aerogenes]